MSSKDAYYTYGPSGGIGGNAFYVAWPPGAFKIIRVWGQSGSRINQIGLDWSTVDGVVQAGPFGGEGGSDFSFPIDSGDYLTQILGTVGEYNDSVRVFSLKFGTQNGKASDTFGTPTEYQFSFTAPSGYQISWIFGRADAELDALGVAIVPIGT